MIKRSASLQTGLAVAAAPALDALSMAVILIIITVVIIVVVVIFIIRNAQ